MSEYCRSREAGALYFFTVVSHGRRPLLTRPELRLSLRWAIQELRLRHPFTIHGRVLLPEHLHCLWQLPQDDADFGRRWSMIKRKVSQDFPDGGSLSLSRQLRGERGIWQRRFWEHLIRDEDDYRRHMDYLHWNPVRHGLVARVTDWPWSSFHCLVREGRSPRDWGGAGEADGEFGE